MMATTKPVAAPTTPSKLYAMINTHHVVVAVYTDAEPRPSLGIPTQDVELSLTAGVQIGQTLDGKKFAPPPLWEPPASTK